MNRLGRGSPDSNAGSNARRPGIRFAPVRWMTGDLRSIPIAVMAPRSGRLLAAALALAAAMVAGCASPPMLHAEVTRFHRWQAGEPRSFVIERSSGQQDSLEHRSYEQRVADRLTALGFVAADPTTARYRVTLDYQATPVPYHQTEYWPSASMGFGVPFGPWPTMRPLHPWGFGAYDPWGPWGAWPSVPITRQGTAYRHVLRVDLYDLRAALPQDRKVFE